MPYIQISGIKNLEASIAQIIATTFEKPIEYTFAQTVKSYRAFFPQAAQAGIKKPVVVLVLMTEDGKTDFSEKANRATKQICDLVCSVTGKNTSKGIYVIFPDKIPENRWGWNGSVFGASN